MPFSRKCESEADYIGLLLMAQACYNPEEAIKMWKRMSKAEKVAPPQFLSTHPNHEARIKKINEWMPEALQKRAESDCLHQFEGFRKRLKRKYKERLKGKYKGRLKGKYKERLKGRFKGNLKENIKKDLKEDLKKDLKENLREELHENKPQILHPF
ncbi:6436_t:CDS:2 [Racocetra fulgida]|uniref:6436_t:CDS:1 n=1 Tax=Racocetra fulgida TaxID=60492 RepID=A0A9N8YWW4_9GLOM|nr:6436_t:CDS:2 [Racocetra fulgida]